MGLSPNRRKVARFGYRVWDRSNDRWGRTPLSRSEDSCSINSVNSRSSNAKFFVIEFPASYNAVCISIDSIFFHFLHLEWRLKLPNSASVSRSPSPTQYEDANERPSSADSSKSTYTDAHRGFPVPELLDRMPKRRIASPGDEPSLESRFDQLTIGTQAQPRRFANPAAAQQFKDFGHHWLVSRSDSESAMSQGNTALLSKEAGDLTLRSYDRTTDNPNASFLDQMRSHFAGSELVGESLLSSTTFSFAEKFINNRPQDEHLVLSEKLAAAVTSEALAKSRDWKSREEIGDGIDRAVHFLVHKDIESEDTENSYREIMAKLIYLKNAMFGKGQIGFPPGFNPPGENELPEADRVLINQMVQQG